MHIYVAPNQAVLNIKSCGRLLEEIFAGLQRALAMQGMQEDESVRAANDARGLQFVGDSVGGVARTKQHELLPGRSHWKQQAPCKPSCDRENSQEQECENRAH